MGQELGVMRVLIMRVAIAGALFALSACKPNRTEDMFPNGEEWLQWNTSTREQYVRAYMEGFTQGFVTGCEKADTLAISSTNGSGFIEANQHCVDNMPFTGARDQMKLIPSVTTFFERYSEQRELRVSHVLRRLEGGRTVEQVHEDFSPKR